LRPASGTSPIWAFSPMLRRGVIPPPSLGPVPEYCSSRARLARSGQTPFAGFLSLRHLQQPYAVRTGTPRRLHPPPGFGYPPGVLRVQPPRPVCFAGTAPLGFPLRRNVPPTGRRMSPRACPRLPSADASPHLRTKKHRLGFRGLIPAELRNRTAVVTQTVRFRSFHGFPPPEDLIRPASSDLRRTSPSRD
jgi:hypothetical protein